MKDKRFKKLLSKVNFTQFAHKFQNLERGYFVEMLNNEIKSKNHWLNISVITEGFVDDKLNLISAELVEVKIYRDVLNDSFEEFLTLEQEKELEETIKDLIKNL